MQALVDDLLGVHSNRVSVMVEKDGTETMKHFELDSDNDSFWAAHRGSPFPEAIAANGEEVAEVTKKEEEVRKKTGESAADTEAEAALIARYSPVPGADASLPSWVDDCTRGVLLSAAWAAPWRMLWTHCRCC